MKTRYLSTQDSDIRLAADIIKDGGLVVFPTETVYGLGGNAEDPRAAKAIYAAKGRPSDNPLIVHVTGAEMARRYAAELPESAEKLAEAIWPGPLTMVLPKKPVVPDETTGGLKTVALRCPAGDAVAKLIEYSGVGIAAPSANISGRPSPTRWEHAAEDLDGKVDAVIQGPPCIGGIESTIVDLTEEAPAILRPGLITPERISQVLGVPCGYDPAITGPPDAGLVPRAPGMKYRHYAPRAAMALFSGSPENVRRAIGARAAELSAKGVRTGTLIYEDGLSAAENLFADLRRLDEEGCEYILASALPASESVNYSVMNRMLKAAGYNIVEV